MSEQEREREEVARLVDERPEGECYCDLVGWCAVCDERLAES